MTAIYLDGTGCTSCALQNLRPWARHKPVLDKYSIGLLLVINHSNEQAVIEILKAIDTFDAFDIVFDKTGEFRTINDEIFKVAHDGIFIFDEHKNVIFNESPLKSEEKWNAFIKLITK